MAALVLRTCVGNLLNTACRGHRTLGVRYLFTDLQYDAFLQKRRATIHYFLLKKEFYFQTFELKLQNSEEILGSAVKSLIYLCETESEVQLAKKCLLRYSETADIKNNYVPLFLRLCHTLGLPDTAFELLMNKSYKGAFCDYSSFVILLDILYKRGQYERVLEVLQEMRTQSLMLNRTAYTYAFATCYKLNNVQSFKVCTSFFEEAVMKGIQLSRLSLCFLTVLALRQEDYDTVYCVYGMITKKNTALCYNLGLLLAAKFDEKKVLQMLETSSEPPSFDFLGALEFCKEVMDAVEKNLESTDSIKKFHDLYEKLRNSGLITSLTLDEMLHAAAAEESQSFPEKKPYRREQMQQEVSPSNNL